MHLAVFLAESSWSKCVHMCSYMCSESSQQQELNRPRPVCVVHTSFSHWNKDVCIPSPPLTLLSSPLLSLLLGYWSSRALWVQRVKAWKAKQPRFQRSHESLKCLLFQAGPGRHVHCASDPRAHLEIQWLNLAHPTLNQSIPIISYCLPSATGPDEAEREREKIPSEGLEVESAVTLWVSVCICVCFAQWGRKCELVTLVIAPVWKHFLCFCNVYAYTFLYACIYVQVQVQSHVCM